MFKKLRYFVIVEVLYQIPTIYYTRLKNNLISVENTTLFTQLNILSSDQIACVKTGNAGAGWGYMTFYGEKKGRHFSASPLNQRAQWQPHSIALCII